MLTRRVHLGYLLGLLTTVALLLDALTAHPRGAARADAIVAYATFAGLGVVGVAVGRRWTASKLAQLGFLVPAYISLRTGMAGLPQFWAYALGFLAAAIVGITPTPAPPPDHSLTEGRYDR